MEYSTSITYQENLITLRVYKNYPVFNNSYFVDVSRIFETKVHCPRPRDSHISDACLDWVWSPLWLSNAKTLCSLDVKNLCLNVSVAFSSACLYHLFQYLKWFDGCYLQECFPLLGNIRDLRSPAFEWGLECPNCWLLNLWERVQLMLNLMGLLRVM